MAVFPTDAWIDSLCTKLNGDAHYGEVAKKWEGDIRFIVEPGGTLKETLCFYVDLWHGKCRQACFEKDQSTIHPAFIMKAPYPNLIRILNGELDPMTALMTRKLGVQGNFSILMRNVPVVLDFVRCCREITTGVL